ncbi:hypothetical protein V6N13_140460 [Hibiscus sabdariffa]|uniref:FAS1 domain-containing protein n=2 Tax=Hibiscus sabdariffa TaxID=183260 RepID=A0ABR2QA33_9ROSI
MEFSRIFMISCSVFLLCSSLAYGQAASPPAPAAMSPSPTPAPAPAPAYVNLTYLLSVAGPFHNFLDYLESTKVMDTFQNQANNTEQGITIFVPKDSAFKALKKPSLSNLSNDQLKSLILFHAMPKFYSLADFNDLSAKGPISTLAGGQYTLNFTDNSGTVHLNSGWSKTKVTSAVHSTDPVAIYQVDKVLLPEAIFGTDIPPMPAPAPAPAPDVSPSADAPSADSKGSASPSKSSQSTSSSHRSRNLGIWSQLVLALLGGWILFL